MFHSKEWRLRKQAGENPRDLFRAPVGSVWVSQRRLWSRCLGRENPGEAEIQNLPEGGGGEWILDLFLDQIPSRKCTDKIKKISLLDSSVFALRNLKFHWEKLGVETETIVSSSPAETPQVFFSLFFTEIVHWCWVQSLLVHQEEEI